MKNLSVLFFGATFLVISTCSQKVDIEAEKENLKLIEARYDAINVHDWDRFQRFYADSIVWNESGLPAPIKGSTAVRKRLETLATAFPDLHWKLDRIFGHREYVCAEFTFTGTHRGVLPDNRGDKLIPATNKSIRIQACGVYTVRAGKIIESKIYFDFGNLKSQIQE